jgi:polyisoprenoid-binding protein YceI
MNKHLIPFLLLILGASAPLHAANYIIDTKDAHAFIQFRISHLGYSWLYGRFNDFDGTFYFDEQVPDAARVEVNIRTASIDSNHAERDKHLRDADFLHTRKYPTATFIGTRYEDKGDGKGLLTGDLTLRGVTRAVTIEVEHIGAGPDPWGGERRGFFGTTQLVLKDFGIDYNLGPAAHKVYLDLSIEGIRQ